MILFKPTSYRLSVDVDISDTSLVSKATPVQSDATKAKCVSEQRTIEMDLFPNYLLVAEWTVASVFAQSFILC